MSVYKEDNPKHLEESIESMINQTLKSNDFVIVVDGEINEKLNNILNKYSLKYDEIKIIKFEKNYGLGVALREGLAECVNDLVVRMDSDDISYPNRCLKQITFMNNNPEISVSGSNMDEFNEDSKIITSIKKMPSSYKDIYNYGKRRNPFNHPTVIFRKNIILKLGNYSKLRKGQDFELFNRLLYSGVKGMNINESLLMFRTSESLYHRRKRYDVRKNYVDTIRKSYKNGYSSFFDLLLANLYTLLIFLLPAKILKFIYLKILRKRSKYGRKK